MNAHEKEQRAQALEAQLLDFHQHNMPLQGVAPFENMLAFVWQLIDSIQRVSYVQVVRARPISASRADPQSPFFDPIRAAVALSAGQSEEAFWLVFLATHCGRNLRTEWRLAAELYGASEAVPWRWARVQNDPQAYADWVQDHHETFEGKFGNHRKYESLKPGPKGTGAIVRSYVDWITGLAHTRQWLLRREPKPTEMRVAPLAYFMSRCARCCASAARAASTTSPCLARLGSPTSKRTRHT